MKLEDLLECPVDELDKFTPEQLEEFTKPFWPITRPENVVHTTVAKKVTSVSMSLEKKRAIEEAKEMARRAGINLI